MKRGAKPLKSRRELIFQDESDRLPKRCKEFKCDDQQNLGVWVECILCKKWRHLKYMEDPVDVCDEWNCTMNENSFYNTCEAEEEEWTSKMEEKCVFNEYTSGSVVWAKRNEKCWFPAMVDDDPDVDNFFIIDDSTKKPLQYHVVFLDECVTRRWLPTSYIKPFKPKGKPIQYPFDDNDKGYPPYGQLQTAKALADHALTLPLKSRLKEFGFKARRKNNWPKNLNGSFDQNSFSTSDGSPELFNNNNDSSLEFIWRSLDSPMDDYSSYKGDSDSSTNNRDVGKKVKRKSNKRRKRNASVDNRNGREKKNFREKNSEKSSKGENIESFNARIYNKTDQESDDSLSTCYSPLVNQTRKTNFEDENNSHQNPGNCVAESQALEE